MNQSLGFQFIWVVIRVRCSDRSDIWSESASVSIKTISHVRNGYLQIWCVFGAHVTKILVFHLPALASKNTFFPKWKTDYWKQWYPFSLVRKSSPLRSLCWSGKYHPTSELGERSKTSFCMSPYLHFLPSSTLSRGREGKTVIVLLKNLFWTVLRAQRSDEFFRTSIMTAEASSFEPKRKDTAIFKNQSSILRKNTFSGANAGRWGSRVWAKWAPKPQKYWWYTDLHHTLSNYTNKAHVVQIWAPSMQIRSGALQRTEIPPNQSAYNSKTNKNKLFPEFFQVYSCNMLEKQCAPTQQIRPQNCWN